MLLFCCSWFVFCCFVCLLFVVVVVGGSVCVCVCVCVSVCVCVCGKTARNRLPHCFFTGCLLLLLYIFIF